MEPSASASPPARDGTETASSRSMRQLGLFFTGSAFVLLSSLVTRRAIVRRTASVRPPFFHPSNEQPLVKFNGPLEALDALGVATINVFSYGIMIGGGLFWAFDIANLKELKGRIKMNKINLPKTEEEAKHQDDDMVATWPAAALALREEQMKQQRKERTESPTIQQRAQTGPSPDTGSREGLWRRDGTFR